MVQLIKKGGLRERANRSSKYAHSENNIKTLDPHRYNTQLQEADKKKSPQFSEDENKGNTIPNSAF